MWIGNPEKCDCCQESYPMSWIIFDGKRFLCTACNYEVKENENANIEECDLCHYDYPLDQMTISYNQILCKKCARDDAAEKQKQADEIERQRDFDEAEQNGWEAVRQKYE